METGLSTTAVATLLRQHGYNEIPEKQQRFVTKLLHKCLSPISGMLLAAALLSFFVGKVFDGSFILLLLLINIFIALWQEQKADDAIHKLNEHLSQEVKALRDGVWKEIPSRELVPGDLIELSSGEIIPADGTVVTAKHVSVNESALTGESLPKDKNETEQVYSGSFMTTGIATVRISATGTATNFGKTISSVETLRKRSSLEKDILDISKFLTFLSLGAITLLSVVFILQRINIFELLTLDLSLLIAGVPISLPTIMTLIIEFGVLALARKNAVVRRLSALEDLANVTFLLTDKTGTLTKNEITIQQISVYTSFTSEQLLLYAQLATAPHEADLISKAITQKAAEANVERSAFQVLDFYPADSVRKRSTAVVQGDGVSWVISLGAPQVILALCRVDEKTKATFKTEVDTFAQKGYRTLAVACKKDTTQEAQLDLVGLLALSDILRPDAKQVIEFLHDNSIGVAMVTGDNRAIATQIAQQLSLGEKKIITREQLKRLDWGKDVSPEFYTQTAAFAEVLPEDKLQLVQTAKRFFVVAANGDGVNDLPAIKAAQVGIAVKNAVSAVKATADLVLLTDGISVIRDAIIESRKIFARLYTYSLYRISESLRLIITITVLGLLYNVYPLTALQIIVLALLNDIPIISLATDRVKIAKHPAHIHAKRRFALSSLYGMVGVANSLILFLLMRNVLHLPWATIQTVYFLKMTVSGHLLIYVAHTKERWWKFLPSKQVIMATTITQTIATLLAVTGFLMPTRISFLAVLVVWGWSLFWMQISEIGKVLQQNMIQ